MKLNYKITTALVLSAIALLSTALAAPTPKPDIDGIHCASEEDYQWWRNARFGIFIHWGPGAFVHANSLSWPKTSDRPNWHELGYMADHTKADELSTEEVRKYYKQYKKGGKNGTPSKIKIYNSLYKIFNPVNFDADKIAQMAKDAGAGYVVFTTKHHDGFCMWDSAYTDYDIMNTPIKRDICKELADACHKRGLRMLWYYSVLDMHDARYNTNNPKPYEDYLFNQVQELLTKYGSIEGMWWDGGKIKKDNVQLFKMMNKTHPGILSNGRIGKVPCGVSFGSPEQKLGSFNMNRPWETCAVVNGTSWIWNGGEDIKSLNTCLQMLVGCAVGDGNLLLNFGPEPDGTVTPKVQELYHGIGSFLKEYGESIYKTRGGPYKPSHWGGTTRRDNAVYLHITQRWPSGILKLPALPAKIVSAECLTGGKVKYKQTADTLLIKIDPKDHHTPDTIVKLTLNKNAMSIEPIKTLRGLTLTTDAKVTASSSINPNNKKGAPETVVSYSIETGKIKKEFGEESEVKKIAINHQTGKKWTNEERERILRILGKNNRGHFWRYWQPKPNDKQPWIELDLGRSETFSSVGIRELFGQIRGFKIQAWKNKKWETFYEGDTLDTLFVDLGKPITAQRVRLVILGDTGETPNLVEFDLFK